MCLSVILCLLGKLPIPQRGPLLCLFVVLFFFAFAHFEANGCIVVFMVLHTTQHISTFTVRHIKLEGEQKLQYRTHTADGAI